MKIQYSMSFAMSKDGFPAFNAIRETEISCPFCRRHVRLALPDLGFEYDRPEADAAYKMMDEMDALIRAKYGISPKEIYLAERIAALGDKIAVELLVQPIEKGAQA